MFGHQTREQGQTITLVAIAIVPLLLFAGLVIDMGWAFSQQRETQNAMDAAANAGAVVMVQNLPYTSRGLAAVRTDDDVKAEIDNTAVVNGVTNPVAAIYTRIDGTPLDPVVTVGSRGSAPPPSEAYGVQVEGSRDFETFFARVRGIFGFVAASKATAVSGQITTICATDEPCAFLPVTFPTMISTCDNTGRQVLGGSTYAATTTPNQSNLLILPLCGTSAGSVGWLDIEPPNPDCSGNGAAELACRIGDSSGVSLPLPAWVATQTGNTNSNGVQTALDAYTGDIAGTYEPGKDVTVQIPIYDCLDNDVPQPSTTRPCPSPEVTTVGTHTSYHIVGVLAFILDGAYVQGNNNPVCTNPPGQPIFNTNGMPGCLKGWITQIITTGPVGEPTGGTTPNTVWGTQLIR